jgi:FixJ family two-component response regulator
VYSLNLDNALLKVIHVIEDHPSILEAILLMLEMHHFIGDGYTNGLHILKGNFKIPSLFLIDYELPKLTGIEICLLLKDSPMHSMIPVLLTSAQSNLKSRCIQAGAVGFLEKPFDMKVLIKMVSDHAK